MEAGVGAEGVEDKERVEIQHPTIALVYALSQPGDRLIVFAQTYTDLSQKETTDVRFVSLPFEIAKDREGFLPMPGEAPCPAEEAFCNRVSRRSV